MKRFIPFLAACAITPCATAQSLPPVTYQLNPTATYLLHPASPVAMPLVINLASIDAAPGDCLEFTVNGNYQCQMPSNPSCVSTSTGVVFSSSNTVLPQNQMVRVPGAINAGLSIVTAPLCGPNGSGATDIPFDFRADIPGSGLAAVPQGAAFLIVGSPDCYNSDNLDSNADFAVTITVIHHTVCPADIAPAICRDNVVNAADLLAVINSWGPCADPNNCSADIAPPGGDDTVNAADLLTIINNWGPCPT